MKYQIKNQDHIEQNLILTGMMGVGKSTVGKGLAERLGYTFIDVDKIIEKRGNLN